MTGLQGNLYHLKIDLTSNLRGYWSTNDEFGGLAIYEQLHLGYVNDINVTARQFFATEYRNNVLSQGIFYADLTFGFPQVLSLLESPNFH